MSRIGSKPILIPPKVEVAVEGRSVRVKGPKGELARTLPADMIVRRADSQIEVERPGDEGAYRALHGLTRSLVANMVEGVSRGFQKSLELSGVGYRAQVNQGRLVLQVGLSHVVEISPPPGITFAVEGTNRVHVQGIDKELVGETAAGVRRVRPPNPYKLKGIIYVGEKVRRKAGKAGKVGAKKK